MNLDEVFTYNHITLISLRSRSRVKASMVLTNAGHLCMHNYIRSLLNIILRPILRVGRGMKERPTSSVFELSYRIILR